MTKQQINLVRHSWKVIELIMPGLENVFYQHLSRTAPRTTDMIVGRVGMHPGRLMHLFCTVTTQLNNLDAVTPQIKDLAAIQQKHDIPPGMYMSMCSSLLGIWKEKLADGWNKELEEAWLTGGALLANTLNALRQPA